MQYPYSLLGKTIKGRSQAGRDFRERPTSYQREAGQPQNHIVDYYPGSVGLTPEQQRFQHQATVGCNSCNPGRAGVPLTDEERARRHYQIYGTQQLPPRGTGLARAQTHLNFDWGTFVAGGVLGLIFGFFIFTATGRKIGYRVGERITR